jgi:hypothetical protein
MRMARAFCACTLLSTALSFFSAGYMQPAATALDEAVRLRCRQSAVESTLRIDTECSAMRSLVEGAASSASV